MIEPMTTVAPPLLEVRGATVRYGAELALSDVDFRVRAGEVHSLMGENGAGKSTLIKAITGALRLDSGEITLDGVATRFASPAHAQAAGISTVYQEIELLPNLTVAENVCLGREPRRFGAIDHREMRRRAGHALGSLGVDIDPAAMLGSFSLAVQQLVAIARAVSTDLRVLVLDEPTSSLDADEVAELFRVIRELKASGIAIIFISHFLDQVYEICDRITVLRGGSLVGEFATTELLRIDLVEKMLGSAATTLDPVGQRVFDSDDRVPVLSAAGLSSRAGLRDADVELAEGEVLGLAGLLGSGRTELARALTGVDPVASGDLRLDGRRIRLDSPREGITAGVVYSSENRRQDGIIAELSVLENITLALQSQRGIFHRLTNARRRELATSWVEALHIRPADVDRPVSSLSGGNQQKVLLARLLALAPRVLVLDEPTRGIDVGAKAEIQRLVTELADNGLSIVYISAELEEVLRVAHIVAIMRDGALAQIVSAADITPDALIALVAQPDAETDGSLGG